MYIHVYIYVQCTYVGHECGYYKERVEVRGHTRLGLSFSTVRTSTHRLTLTVHCPESETFSTESSHAHNFEYFVIKM